MALTPRQRLRQAIKSFTDDGAINGRTMQDTVDFLIDHEELCRDLLTHVVQSEINQMYAAPKQKRTKLGIVSQPPIEDNGVMDKLIPVATAPKMDLKRDTKRLMLDLASMKKPQVIQLATEIEADAHKEVETAAFLRVVAAYLGEDETVGQRMTVSDLWNLRNRVAVVPGERKIYLGDKYLPAVSKR